MACIFCFIYGPGWGGAMKLPLCHSLVSSEHYSAFTEARIGAKGGELPVIARASRSNLLPCVSIAVSVLPGDCFVPYNNYGGD